MSSKIGSCAKRTVTSTRGPMTNPHRRDLGLVVLVEPNRRRAEIERAVVEDQAARRFDLAQRILGRNADPEQSFDELLFFRGRVQKISPDDLGRHLRADLLPVVGWPPVQFEQEPNSAYPRAGSHGLRPSCAELTHEGSERSKSAGSIERRNQTKRARPPSMMPSCQCFARRVNGIAQRKPFDCVTRKSLK